MNTETIPDTPESLTAESVEEGLGVACSRFHAARDHYQALFIAWTRGEEIDGEPVSEEDLAAAEVDCQRLNGLYSHIEMRVLGIGAIKGVVEQQHSSPMFYGSQSGDRYSSNSSSGLEH